VLLLGVARDILWTTLTLAESEVELITLLEIDVLEAVADNGPCGNGIPVQIDARYVRNRAFNGRERLT